MITILGALFHIDETNIKDILKKRLQDINLQETEKEVQDRIQKSIKTPRPVFQNCRCQKYRSWIFDPTAVLDKDIVDNKGHILKKKGSTYNFLQHTRISTQLVFIDGTDNDQMIWALKQPCSKIVSVNGSPIDLEEKHKVPIYFDQQGFLCRKFGITVFPARVFQEKNVLRCEEISLEGVEVKS